MDDFARLPRQERQLYFEQAAARLGLSAQIIEKDFWVCWSLKRLFSLAEFHNHLTFKGGTSLSKIFKVIERFSEDVDVAIERDFLGFGGDMEPEKGKTGKEQQRRIEDLKKACQAKIAEQLTPQLHETISACLVDLDWGLSLDPDDNDQQTLLFRYPAAITAGLSSYFAASVKIELGARSDHFPVENAPVSPSLADAIADALTDNAVHVRVLGAERTFWEKVTILHMLHHFPLGKMIAPRMSRHYYDVFQMSNSTILHRALKNLALLDRVASHKSIFFKSAWAKYAEACPGTLRLVPREDNISPLKQDYGAMQPMFFGKPPDFDQILHRLGELEKRINDAVE